MKDAASELLLDAERLRGRIEQALALRQQGASEEAIAEIEPTPEEMMEMVMKLRSSRTAAPPPERRKRATLDDLLSTEL